MTFNNDWSVLITILSSWLNWKSGSVESSRLKYVLVVQHQILRHHGVHELKKVGKHWDRRKKTHGYFLRVVEIYHQASWTHCRWNGNSSSYPGDRKSGTFSLERMLVLFDMMLLEWSGLWISSIILSKSFYCKLLKKFRWHSNVRKTQTWFFIEDSLEWSHSYGRKVSSRLFQLNTPKILNPAHTSLWLSLILDASVFWCRELQAP